MPDNIFLMTTGSRQPTYFHSEHRQLPWCREVWPSPRIEMNPKDAERIGPQAGRLGVDRDAVGQGPRGARFVLRHLPGRGERQPCVVVPRVRHRLSWLRAGGHQRGERPLRPGHRRRLRHDAFHPDRSCTRPRPRIPRSAIRFRAIRMASNVSMMPPTRACASGCPRARACAPASKANPSGMGA